MAGISSKALNNAPENKFKFNDGTELNSTFDINLYETAFRSHDPQLGRFWQVDPLAEASYSLTPYHFVSNNPLLFNDPYGLDTVRINGEGSFRVKVREGDILAWTMGDNTSYYTYDPSNPNAVNGFVGGGIATTDPAIVVSGRKRDNTTPFQLGVEWLTGSGTREHHFKDGDLFTRMLQQHSHVADTRQQIASGLTNGSVVPNTQYTNGYSLGGIAGVPKYFRDYSTLMTGGMTGNLAVTYLGSYGLRYEVISVDEASGTARVKFYVANSSTAASAMRPPVIGYTDFWNKNVGSRLNSTLSGGPMSKTRQTVEWTETIKFR